jgi:hypothetical protein
VTAPRADPATVYVAARAAALYMMSVAGAACAHLAWGGAGGGVLASAAVLAAALVAGEVGAPALADAHRTWRARGRTGVSVFYATLLFLVAMMVAGAPTPGLVARVTLALVFAQAAALAVGGAMDDHALAVANAYALLALAALRGDGPAVVAAVSVPLAHTLFLAHDGAARTLSAYAARRGPGPGAVWAAWARVAVLPGVLLTAWLLVLPPRPYPGIRWADEDAAGAPAAAWRLLAVVALVGTGLVYLASQLLRRRGGKGTPIEEVIDAAAVDEEAALPPEEIDAAALPGPRGRVVRAYLLLLARAARLGFARRPDWTPREYANVLRAPGAPLDRLTRVFMDARYGDAEPGEAEADAAEAAAGEVLADLQRRRRPVRPRP